MTAPPSAAGSGRRIGLSVQQALEEAIGRFSGEAVTTQAAGRTDAGVHALGQVAHFDLSKDWDPFRIREALNYHLKPHPVAIVECRCGGRRLSRRGSRPTAAALRVPHPQPPRSGRRWSAIRSGTCPGPWTRRAMHEAAQLILGLHDFTTFRSSECQAKSPLRDARCLRCAQRRRNHLDQRRAPAASCTIRCAPWWDR